MKSRDNEGENSLFDPYAVDDPNVGAVHYGSPDAPSAPDATAAPDVAPDAATDAAERSFAADVRYGSPDEFHDARRPDDPDASPDAASPRRAAIDELSHAGDRAITKKQLSRRVQSKSRHARRKVSPAILIVVIAYALVIGACVLYAVVSRHTPTAEPVETEPEVVVTPQSAALEQTKLPDGFIPVEKPSDAVHEGDLILVNYAYPYVFPENPDTVSVYDYKTKSYKVRDTNVSLSKAVVEKFNRLMDDFAAATGCADMMVVSGFRNYEFQNDIWVDRVQTEGEEEAAKYVAIPGYSEHHTALAMDLSVYLSDGRTVYVEDYELCDWFEEHAPEYGFVLRYPAVKAATTHISFESWHYRYVGVPHGEIMYEKDMCLEEYVDFLRSYKCGEKYLGFRRGASFESDTLPTDADYVVYYVPRFDGDTTVIPVPDGAEYELSGNNVDGFVVTLKYKK